MIAKYVCRNIQNESIEDDKKRMKILKSYRIKLFVVIMLILIIDISDFLTKDASFWSGLFTGVFGVLCTVALVINYRLSKRIRMRKE